jgi:hypothetical protein
LKRAQEIRAERILHPETIPEKGHLMVVPDIPDDDSPEVIDWIQTYMEWMDGNPEYSKRTVEQTQYLQERMKEFLKAKRRPHITLMKFDKTWFKAFFLWLKNDYVPQKYVRVKAKPLSNATLRKCPTTHCRSIQQGCQDWQVEGKPLLSVGEGRHYLQAKGRSQAVPYTR